MSKICRVLSLLIVLVLMLSLSACSIPFIDKKDEKPEVAVEEEKPKEEKIDTSFTAETSVSYSSGSDSNWSYGNQRKEFPQNEACYVRVGSTIVSQKNKGVGTEIAVTYRFTGTQNCKVELSDGIATQDIIQENVIEYTRTIAAEKSKNAKEDIVIFQYIPSSSADSMILEVIYDDHVVAKYDIRNTVYFSKSVSD